MARPGSQDVVEAFASEGADPAFRDRVGSRCARAGVWMMLGVGTCEHGVVRVGELAVPVPDKKPVLGGTVTAIHQQVPGPLGDPPGFELDHDEHVEPGGGTSKAGVESGGEGPRPRGVRQGSPRPSRRRTGGSTPASSGSGPARYKCRNATTSDHAQRPHGRATGRQHVDTLVRAARHCSRHPQAWFKK
jgi:hypothetical protein